MRAWHPCCCRKTPCFWTGDARPDHLNWIAEVEGDCDCLIDGETGVLTYTAASDPPNYSTQVTSTCADYPLPSPIGQALFWDIHYYCLPGEPYARLSATWDLLSQCRIGHPNDVFDFYLQLASLTYRPVFQAVFRGRMYEGYDGNCRCIPGNILVAAEVNKPGPLITFTLTEP